MKLKVGLKNTCFCFHLIILNFVLLLGRHCHAMRPVSRDRHNSNDGVQEASHEKTANALVTQSKLVTVSNFAGAVQRDSKEPLEENLLEGDFKIPKPSLDIGLDSSLEDVEGLIPNDVWSTSKTSHQNKSIDQTAEIIKIIKKDISPDIVTDVKAPLEDISSDGVDKMKDNKSMRFSITSQGNESSNDLKMPHLSSEVTSPFLEEEIILDSFNYSDAIVRGKVFQMELCSTSKCGGRRVRYTFPKCAECHCDEVCIKYRDCCNVSDEMKLKYESTERLETECFEFDSELGVVVVSSCPETIASQRAIPFGSVGLGGGKNSTKAQIHLIKCQKCQRSKRRKSLVTSKITGITYCNKHCLVCNEPQTKSPSRLFWEKIKTCYKKDVTKSMPSLMPSVSEGNSSRKNETKMTQVCTVIFVPPYYEMELSFRPCSIDTHLEEVNDCGNNSMEIVDNKTFSQLEVLCGSYYWPVYSMNSVFRNMFCFLCRGHKPHDRGNTIGVTTFDLVGEFPNLAMLTDLTGRFSKVDDSLERMAYENSGQSVSQSDEDTLQSSKNRSGIFHAVVHTCESGFWFNYLNDECLPVRCSNGRNLTRPSDPTDSSHSTDVQSCLPANDEARIDDGAEFYVLNVLWYLVSNDLGRENGDEEEDGETLDRETDYAGDDDVPSHNDSRQKTSFSCDAYNAGGYDKVSTPQHDAYLESNPIIPAPFVDYKLSFDYQTIPNNDVIFKNASEADEVFDRYLLNETDWLLRQANVSSFLMKTKFNYAKESQGNNDTSMRFLEIVAYFQRTYFEGLGDFERSIVDLFSIKTETFYDEKAFEFRSVLVRKHDIVRNDTQKVRYFSHKDSFYNDTVCCDEINAEEFSAKLSTMACAVTNLKPVNIHLVSTCPHVILNSTEFKMTTKQILIHKRTGITLQRHHYLRSKSSILICTSVLDSLRSNLALSTSADHLMWWESLLTLLFLPVSMLCLLITFTTYCMFPVLRSMPGKNNMFLVFWLFWAQTFTIVSPLTSRYSTACVVMGMLLHFSWLATLAWTCVCSFHMFNVFVIQKGTPNDSRSHRWYITCYSLLSHLFPLFVIIVVCVTSHSLTSTGSLGYGEVVCYLNSTILIVLAFLLPLTVILVANMAFFFCTVISIARIEKIKRQTGIAEKRNSHIYAKLSSLTSITWVLALLAEIPGCHFLRLVSVIVNSCQGVFLFVSYILNKRVKRLWKSIRKSKRSRKSNLASNTYTNVSGTSTKPLTISTPNLNAL